MSKARLVVALVIFLFLHVLHVSASLPWHHYHNHHIHHDRRNVTRRHGPFRPHRVPPPRPTPPVQPNMTLVDREYLSAHNAWRAKVNVPVLEWNETLAEFAQNWAVQRKSDCYYRHHSMGPYGENTFWEQYDEYTATNVVKSWFEEYVFFDPVRNVCKCIIETDECQCSHYLAVVWKTTKQVGCGEVTCDLEKGRLVVCSYFPPGNHKFMDPLNPFM